ncbi:hypothetical protein MNR02_02810 [Shinella sp. H4-D48]|uniref:hypothetical protein n=1 Tax=Shinella sp. H4-D48 TaxID=2925841 RepID=UPI001F533D75|nr:hypothetical protein [Shinella sp. H4-D48]UNK38655.1 hypothetical protein MNR02_02810 [Shinella sp. H4-D48]
MTVSTMELKLQEIRSETGLSRQEKIARLEKLRSEARALQRAATESAMVDDDGWYEDVHLIDTELENLGRPIEEKGAATL